mgnify:CR=1 FL=1
MDFFPDSDATSRVYYPSGVTQSETTDTLDTTLRFTGQRLIVDLGMYFYQTRWYDPVSSRWLQADSLVPDPFNPMDWDRYAYVQYNPIRYDDPTGHMVDDGLKNEGGGSSTDVPLTDNGYRVYTLYMNYNMRSGWWNHNEPGALTPKNFLGLAIVWERSSIPDLASNPEWIQEATARQIWMVGDKVHDPYCTMGKPCINGIFNFLGAYAGMYHNTSRFTIYDNPKAQPHPTLFISTKGENLDSIMDTAAIWGDKIINPPLKWTRFDENGLFDWGNVDKAAEATASSLPQGTGVSQIFYFAPENFVIRTYTQFIHPSW